MREKEIMPKYMAPPATPVITQAQPMYYQQPPMQNTCCEPSCAYGGGYAGETGCGCPSAGCCSYGPAMDCGSCSPCGSCGTCNTCGTCGSCSSCGSGSSGCCDGAAAGTGPTPKEYTEPAPPHAD